jgi:hypothetical protein
MLLQGVEPVTAPVDESAEIAVASLIDEPRQIAIEVVDAVQESRRQLAAA